MLFCSISCRRSVVHHSLKHRHASRIWPYRRTTSLWLQSEGRKARARNLSYAPIPGVGRRFTITIICYDIRDKKATVVGSHWNRIQLEVSSCTSVRHFQMQTSGENRQTSWLLFSNLHEAYPERSSKELDGICRQSIIDCSCATTSNM